MPLPWSVGVAVRWVEGGSLGWLGLFVVVFVMASLTLLLVVLWLSAWAGRRGADVYNRRGPMPQQPIMPGMPQPSKTPRTRRHAAPNSPPARLSLHIIVAWGWLGNSGDGLGASRGPAPPDLYRASNARIGKAGLKSEGGVAHRSGGVRPQRARIWTKNRCRRVRSSNRRSHMLRSRADLARRSPLRLRTRLRHPRACPLHAPWW